MSTHYKHGIEPLDILRSWDAEQYRGFLRGNVLKYLARYPHKNGVEDLEKAQVYLEKLIDFEREMASDAGTSKCKTTGKFSGGIP